MRRGRASSGSQWGSRASLGLVLALLGVASISELLRHGYQIEQLNRERAFEEERGHQLRLEIDTLRSPKRIERLAIERLRLVVPSGAEAVVLERVQPADSPAQSVIGQAAMSDPGFEWRVTLRRRILIAAGFPSPVDRWCRRPARLPADHPLQRVVGSRRAAAVGKARYAGQTW